jgi:hypothetical protein
MHQTLRLCLSSRSGFRRVGVVLRHSLGEPNLCDQLCRGRLGISVYRCRYPTRLAKPRGVRTNLVKEQLCDVPGSKPWGSHSWTVPPLGS